MLAAPSRSVWIIFLRCFCPKLWLQSKFKHTLNKATDVVTQHLAKCVVDLRRFGLTTKTFIELCFGYAEVQRIGSS